MIRLSKSVLAVSGVILAGGLITVMNPKTVHAVAAALVQVTNTSSNPVVSSDISFSPAQLVELFCSGGGCAGVEPGGALDASPYSVPAGHTLVITEVDIVSNAGGDKAQFVVVPTSVGPGGQSTDPLLYYVANDGLTHTFTLGRGVVFPTGSTFQTQGSPDTVAFLRGYLTSN